VGFVAADQEGSDQPGQRVQYKEQGDDHGRFASVHIRHRRILSYERKAINFVRSGCFFGVTLESEGWPVLHSRDCGRNRCDS
jgi:hypothetical protein